MAVMLRRKVSGLISKFFDEITHYHFFQAIYLLETAMGENSPGQEYLRLLPSSTLSFPAADIKKCEIDNKQRVLLHLNFMGLYGVDSPLPHYFLAQTIQDNENAIKLRSFFNILNHRLYYLLYLAWKKFHPHVQIDNNINYLYYLQALSGNALNFADQDEFAYAGLFGARVNNLANISGMISGYLGNTAVTVKPFVPRWVKLSQSLMLNQNDMIQLGNNAVLGVRVLDLSGRIAIQIGPLTVEQTADLLPGTERHRRLHGLLRRYLGPALEFEIRLVVRQTDGACFRLGENTINLGRMSWIGKLADTTYQIAILANSGTQQ